MIYHHHCYNHQWRQQIWANYLQAANDIDCSDNLLFGLDSFNTAEALFASKLEGEALSEAFDSLSLEEQTRYLDLCEMACPWAIIGLEH